MSEYVRYKVLRLPLINAGPPYAKYENAYAVADGADSGHFQWGTVGKFMPAPTEGSKYIDYVLEKEYEGGSEWGRTRELSAEELNFARSKFLCVTPNANWLRIKLVEYCYYNGCDAPDYYDASQDPFYDSILKV